MNFAQNALTSLALRPLRSSKDERLASLLYRTLLDKAEAEGLSAFEEEVVNRLGELLRNYWKSQSGQKTDWTPRQRQKFAIYHPTPAGKKPPRAVPPPERLS